MGDEIPELCGGPQYIGFYSGEEATPPSGSFCDELTQPSFVSLPVFNWQTATETSL